MTATRGRGGAGAFTLLVALAVAPLVARPGGAGEKKKAPAAEKVEVRVFLKVSERGRKGALAGARVQHALEDKWYDLGRPESKGAFAALGAEAGKYRGRQANCSARGRAAVHYPYPYKKDKGLTWWTTHPDGQRYAKLPKRAVPLRVVNKGYESAYLTAVFPTGQKKVTHYAEAELVRHRKVGEWAFSEGKGKEAREATGQGQTGKISGATWTAAGLKFDGNDVVDCGTSPAYEPQEAVTVLAWIKPAGKVETIQGLVGRAWVNPWGLSTDEGDGLEVGLFVKSTGYVFVNKAGVLKPGAWNFVGFTYGDSLLRLYANGKKVKELKVTRRLQHWGVRRRRWPPAPHRLHAPSNQPLSVGYFDGVAHFRGHIRRVGLYNYALSEAQVARLYRQGG